MEANKAMREALVGLIDGICHEVIEWADPQPVRTVEQLRGLVEGMEASGDGR